MAHPGCARILATAIVRIVMLLCAGAAASVQADEEFLDPEVAFRFSARLAPDDTLEVRYVIADGYYMYRERFQFSVEPAMIRLGAPRFPQGQWHEDEFFGRSETYRSEVTISIPVVDRAGWLGTIRLVAVSQGCADAGICYLPTTQGADFELLSSPEMPPRSVP
jgi:thiol:disulfide interchange protein DsbD